MSEKKPTRLNRVLKEFNISLERAVDYLKEQGIDIESNPNAKINANVYDILYNNFADDKEKKEASIEIGEEKRKEKEALKLEREKEEQKRLEEIQKNEIIKAKATLSKPKTVGVIDLNPKKTKPTIIEPTPVEEEAKAEAVVETPVEEVPVEIPTDNEPIIVEPVSKKEDTTPEVDTQTNSDVENNTDTNDDLVETPSEEKTSEDKIETKYQKLSGATFTGQKIDLSQFEKSPKKKEDKKDFRKDTKKEGDDKSNKQKRKRIQTPTKPNIAHNQQANKKNEPKNKRQPVVRVEPSEEDVKKQIQETLEKLQGKGNKSKAAKYRREKRDTHRQRLDDELRQQDEENKKLKVTEFITVGEVATMMDVPITKIIGACMSLGIMVTMNQRLDAETLAIVAEEFGFEVEFTTADIEEAIVEKEDNPDDLVTRAPIVTVMGHVDHGKTSLLDYIRKTNVIAGESGGITQHIGAYSVKLDNGQRITFLDTPGHEAFTAMRARGAQVTDIAIIVVAADDDIMPQTKEAIAHAQAAGVPIIFAINKIDKPTANPDKIKERLAGMNLLVEEWGGKIQSQDVSAKQGIGMKELLEKVLVEAEMLELKANPNKAASGTVVEAFLDKGRGYVATVLVQSGTLRVGDYLLAGKNHGKVRAMHDERGKSVKEAKPSTPISVLGLDGAPGAGDKFNVFEDEREAKSIAAKRTQLLREQSVRTQRHITLAEIGRRIALGQFKELNVIVKGDVDGSVEALSDSFSKLSTDEIQINIIHKGVGAITESDVLLASASDAIIIGFNVRPMANAKTLAEKEEIDIRNYSIIYDAIDDLKDAMEGMLSPELREEVTGTAEIRELFKISKVGTIAGCMVTDGKIFRNSKIRLIREGVIIYTGELAALKRFKDDVKEVSKGYDCGMQIKNYNDIKEYDIIEAFQEVEVRKKLK
ncbi:MAG: translation initiation factor IF-2 [Bacteroidota bacterium]|nr:translation initiation factor IF-2 [Bacteroidota bacterium]